MRLTVATTFCGLFAAPARVRIAVAALFSDASGQPWSVGHHLFETREKVLGETV